MDDAQSGQGICAWADGSEYAGAWQGGVRQGRGLFRRPDGHLYEGEWAADARHGQGQCRFETGDK